MGSGQAQSSFYAMVEHALPLTFPPKTVASSGRQQGHWNKSSRLKITAVATRRHTVHHKRIPAKVYLAQRYLETKIAAFSSSMLYNEW